MCSQAADFFNVTVKPTVSEYLTNLQDIRRGRLASIVLYHMADYCALDESSTVSDLHVKLIARCPSFNLIRDVADASKHGRLRVQSKISRTLSDSQQLVASPGLFQVPFGCGVFAEAVEVYAVLDSGEEQRLEPAVRLVVAMWADYFCQ